VVPYLEVRGNGGSEATQHPRKSIGAGHSRIRKAHSHVQKLPVLAHFWQNHTFSRKCFPK
jgi:hypothetical protein